MIFALMRVDPGFHSFRWWIALGLFTGIWLLGAEAMAPRCSGLYEEGSSSRAGAIFIFWILLVIVVLGTGANRRATLLDMILPLPPRTVWLVHMATVAGPCVVVLSIAAGVSCVVHGILGSDRLIDPCMGRLLLQLGAGCFLALAVMQIPKPLLAVIPVTRSYVLLSGAAVIGALGLTLGLAALPFAWTLVPVAVALLLLTRTGNRLSEPFALVPLAPAGGRGPAASPRPVATARTVAKAGRERSRIGFRWLLFTTILRTPVGTWMLCLLPVIFFHGLVLGIGLATKEDVTSLEVPYILFAWIVVSSWTLLMIARLGIVLALPIPRRTVFAAVIFPAALALASGYGAGIALHTAIDRDGTGIVFDKTSRKSLIHVPPEHWEIAPDDHVPSVEAPAGENVALPGEPFRHGGRTRVYNPYQAPPGSSAPFVAFQLSRAFEAVCGRKVPPGDIERDCLDTLDGKILLKEGGFAPIIERYGLERQGRGALFVVQFLVIAFAWLLFAAVLCHAFRWGAIGHGRMIPVYGAFLLALPAGLAAIVGGNVGLYEPEIVARALLVGIRRLREGVPGGTVTLAVAAAFLLGAAYAFALSRFRRMEMQALPRKTGLGQI